MIFLGLMIYVVIANACPAGPVPRPDIPYQNSPSILPPLPEYPNKKVRIRISAPTPTGVTGHIFSKQVPPRNFPQDPTGQHPPGLGPHPPGPGQHPPGPGQLPPGLGAHPPGENPSGIGRPGPNIPGQNPQGQNPPGKYPSGIGPPGPNIPGQDPSVIGPPGLDPPGIGPPGIGPSGQNPVPPVQKPPVPFPEGKPNDQGNPGFPPLPFDPIPTEAPSKPRETLLDKVVVMTRPDNGGGNTVILFHICNGWSKTECCHTRNLLETRIKQGRAQQYWFSQCSGYKIDYPKMPTISTWFSTREPVKVWILPCVEFWMKDKETQLVCQNLELTSFNTTKYIPKNNCNWVISSKPTCRYKY